eukprot:5934644-Ditylum_brightwellii.AAC.1
MLPLFLHSGLPKSSISLTSQGQPGISMMIIICLIWGAALLPLAESVEVVDDGCGDGGDHASERVV